MGSCAGVWPYSVNTIFVYTGAWVIRIKYMYIVKITKEGSAKIINFMTPVLGRGHLSHIVNMYYLLLYQ